MEFPYFGDGEAFLEIGYKCSVGLSKGLWVKFFTGCYNALRPVGAIAYFTVPHTLSADPLTVLYINLAMNLACLMLVVYAVKRIFVDRQKIPSWFDFFMRAFIGFAAIVLFLGMVPVALSDLPAFAVFLSGIVLYWRKRNLSAAFLLGLFGALAALIKQNYYLYGLASALLILLDAKKMPRASLIRFLAAFGAGFGLGGVQFIWNWMHTGLFLPYDPSTAAHFAPSNAQPFVELVAYTKPIRSAYLTRLDSAVDPVSFFGVKMMYSLFSYFPAVYLGEVPLLERPEVIPVTPELLIKAWLSILAWFELTAIAWLRRKGSGAVAFIALLCIGIAVARVHVEYRYIAPFKYLVLCWLFAETWPAFQYVRQKIRQGSHQKKPVAGKSGTCA